MALYSYIKILVKTLAIDRLLFIMSYIRHYLLLWSRKRLKFLRTFYAFGCNLCMANIFSILSFITITFDFYVSISKRARASSLPMNKTLPSSQLFNGFAEILTRMLYRGHANGEFYWFQICAFVSSLKGVGSLAPIIERRSSSIFFAVKFQLRYRPLERTCDLVRFCKPSNWKPS